MPRDVAGWITALCLLGLAIVPTATNYFDEPFALDIATRILILALAACSLNLILGYGGLVSFGHAAYLGIGAYAVGIPAYYENYDGWFQLGIAIVASALFAFLTGLVCLRTRGVYFIMITLAFAQMVYFGILSIEEYGGDDGLVIDVRSEFGSAINLESAQTLYYLILGVLVATLFIIHRIVHARFGMVIRGGKGNEERMVSLGFPVFRYRLVCYVISGVICGVAGWMLGNFTDFISPEMMDWTRSGELIFMVVLGGTASVFGPVLGTATFVLLEEWLSGITLYWQLIFGPFLILVVLFVRGGLFGLLTRMGDRR
ncbi:MAG: branched-chain amino acid ABC transporter permease [Gammaproteobacteria bacterium]|nr:branched-chain amino acid ABC transporter permease [Gammaproteobacteria bacterium]